MAQLDLNKFDAKQWYVSNFEVFEEQLNGSKDTPFHETRKRAISRFAELGFPTPRNEEWKYTNVAPMLKRKFSHATAPTGLSKEVLQDFVFEGMHESVLVFLNGQFSSQLSTFQVQTEGLVVGSLRELLAGHADLVPNFLGKFASFEDESFTALNTAFTDDGACIYVPKNTVVEETIHVLNVSLAQNAPFISHPRKLVVVEQGSQLKFIESFVSLSPDVYFTNQVSEVFVGENAHLHHVKIQQESEQAFHVSNLQAHQELHSSYTTVNIDLGGAIVRNNLNVRLNAENCDTHLFGFYHGEGSQHIDNHTFIDHAKPNCFSNELYKGILDDKSKAVFSGKIIVRQDAQKTNALQSNKTLLLTRDASVNAKPQLEIFADDVKCTHGATIGQLDEEALFYLRARGISETVASAILRYAFAGNVFEKIEIEPVRKKLDHIILQRLKGAPAL